MSFQNDAFSLNFEELYKNYPNRRVTLYRYKVVNWKTTLNKIIVKPRRSVILLLEDEKILQAVQDTYQAQKTTITINSNQSAGTAELFNNETITMITGELIPQDYRNEFYIYSVKPIVKNQISTEDLFLDQLGASIFPELQEPFFKSSRNELEKVTNVLILSKLRINTAGTNTNIYAYNDKEIDYFDGNKNIILRTPGPIGDFGVSFFDAQNHKRQLEYKLIEDTNHAYALLQMQPTKIRPDITFSSDTYDKNKNINFERARNFIGTFKNISDLWGEYGLVTSGNTAEGKLYWAFLTVVFLSNQRLTKFVDYRITDKNNVNLGKIDTSMLKNKLYGIAIDDILNTDQKEFNATVLKTWEQEFSNDLDTRDNIKNLYQELKGSLSALSEYIPSPYSFGNYQKIGRVALEWYFVPEKMNITLDNVFDRAAFKVRLESLKYNFDSNNKTISGLKDAYLKISGVKTFELDGQVTLPSIPETISEENKNTTAGAVDTSNTSFLNYNWVFQLLDSSKYRQLFFTDNPFALQSEKDNSKTLPFQVDNDVLGKGIGTFTGNEVETYITNNYILADRIIVTGSAKAVVTKNRIQTGTKLIDEVTLGTGYNTYYEPVYTEQFKTVFTWREKPKPNITINQISPPFSINQAQWELFESSLGSTVSEFILKPILNIGGNTVQRKISDIQWKGTFGNYAEVVLQAKIKNQNTFKTITFNIEQAFKKDQTITQEGILI